MTFGANAARGRKMIQYLKNDKRDGYKMIIIILNKFFDDYSGTFQIYHDMKMQDLKSMWDIK